MKHTPLLPDSYRSTASAVAAQHGMTLAQLAPGPRNPALQRVRREVWKALLELGASYPECAAVTGHRSHDSVWRGLWGRKVKAQPEAAE